MKDAEEANTLSRIKTKHYTYRRQYITCFIWVCYIPTPGTTGQLKIDELS